MKAHPWEIELSFSSDGKASESIAAHLRWCAHCRSAAADYHWLQGQIEHTLAQAAGAVTVPRARWWTVQEGMRASQRRRVVGRRISSLASIVSAICLMLFAPGFLSPAAATQVDQPSLMAVPGPATAPISAQSILSVGTPTPDVFCEEATPLPTPAFVLPPTPPRVEG